MRSPKEHENHLEDASPTTGGMRPKRTANLQSKGCTSLVRGNYETDTGRAECLKGILVPGTGRAMIQPEDHVPRGGRRGRLWVRIATHKLIVTDTILLIFTRSARKMGVSPRTTVYILGKRGETTDNLQGNRET